MLKKYNDLGFKFFPCKQNKSPNVPSWTDSTYHISLEKAEEMMKMGTLIGAILPSDIVVIDLDRHEGKADGVKKMMEIKKEFDIPIAFLEDTFAVKTAGNGIHIFFKVEEGHPFKQKSDLVESVDVKTDKGYVIAAGSIGYSILCDEDPIEMPYELRTWIKGKQNKPKNKTGKKGEKKLSLDVFERILDKVDVKKYNSNDEWQEFIMSAIAAVGNSEKAYTLLENWSNGDKDYKDARNVRARIQSIDSDGAITVGTFISHLTKNGVPDYLIKHVKGLNVAENFLSDAEAQEAKIPFDIDYKALSSSQEASSFFFVPGQTHGARLLEMAIKGRVIYIESEDKQGKYNKFYFFDGNKYVRIPDMFDIVFTVLLRVSKFIYKNKDDATAGKQLVKILSTINGIPWKKGLLQELAYKKAVFHESVDWDSHTLAETLTTRDGVIDFTGGETTVRHGRPDEYRLKFIDYSTKEIQEATAPKKFNIFLKSLFQDEETYKTARYSMCTFVSGNASKRRFHVWHGSGFNGKSTLIDIIQKIIGEKAISYNTKLLLPDHGSSGDGPTPEMARFRGSQVAFGVESEDNKKLSCGLVKKLTGGDTITANPKYMDPIQFQASWQLVLATNDLPIFNASDNAFIDRLILLPFSLCFYRDEGHKRSLIAKGFSKLSMVKRIEKNIIEKDILEEAPGIIKMWIKDYTKLQNEMKGIIPESNLCKDSKILYISDNDDIGSFIKNMCEIGISQNYFETSENLVEAYRDFCGNHKITSNFIIKSLKKHRIELQSATQSTEGKVSRGLKNIMLKKSETTVPEL